MGQVIVWLLMMFLAYAYMIAVRLHFTYSMMVMMKSPLVAAPHNDHCPGVEINVGINSTIDEKRMDWSLEEQSITMSAYFIGMLFTVFPGGVYANRGYEREIMGLCMFVSAVSVIFCPIAAVQLHSWIAVFVLRFFVGCAFGPVAPCGGTIAGKIIPKSSRALFSTFMFSGTIFGAFSGHLFSGLIIPNTSHSWSFFILGTFAILWSLIWMVMFCKMPYKVLEDASNHSLSVFSTPWKTALQSEAYISLLIASLGFGNLYSFITTGLPIYTARVLGGDAVKNGVNVCQPWLMCWITSIAVGLLSMELIVANRLRKNTVRKLYAGVVLVVCPLMVLSIRLSNCHSSQTKIFIWMAIILLAFERNSIRINSLDLCPKFAGSLIALSDVFFSVGNVLDLFVARNIHVKDFDWNFVFYIATFFPIVCSVPFLLFGTAAQQTHWELVRYRRSSVST